MRPFLHLSFLGFEAVSTNLLLVLLYAFTALVTFTWMMRKEVTPVASLVCFGATTMGVLIGGRLFHVLVERPELWRDPGLMFQRWDGMTFYGSLIGGTLLFSICVIGAFSRTSRRKAFDVATILVSLGYGVLRLGCFANGCCWGKMSAVPWAVRYFDERSLMPALGIPVHPVQLYDSFLGLLLTFFLARLYRKSPEFRGQLFWIFGLLSSLARIGTENFRGDVFRGEDVLIGLSTSQVISLVFALVSAGVLLILRRPRGLLLSPRLVSVGLLLVAAVLFTGCLQVPKPPTVREFATLEILPNSLEIYRSHLPAEAPNAIFLAADASIQQSFAVQMKHAIGRVERIEDFAWWDAAPMMARIYAEVLRVPPEKVRYAIFMQALQTMEEKGRPYDLYLLTHGMPNSLSAGDANYFVSWRELAQLKGRLPHLRLVFLQSCYGMSLAPDFQAAGARAVMAFRGKNRNFFFFHFFLAQAENLPLRQAYAETVRTMGPSLRGSPLFSGLVYVLGQTVPGYLKDIEEPEWLD